MASSEPPHLDEGPRENSRDPIRVGHLTMQTRQHQTRAMVEQLAERTEVVVGDPADQPPQSLWAAAQAG